MQAVDDSFLVTQQRLSTVDLHRPSTIHRLRIAFKTFRYMLEIIHPLLARFPETNLKSMQDYQSLLGEVQDAEVFRQTLQDFSEKASLSDLEAVHRYSDRRLAEAIEAFAGEVNQVHSFWRAASNQPFPWENPQ